MATGPAIAVPIWLLRRSATLAPTALLSAALLGLSAPALADHDVEHVVNNLKGGLGALEQRVWDCERGINGKCPGTKGDTGLKGDKGDTGEKGDTGDTGLKGDKGDTGEKGDTGDTGATGLTGWMIKTNLTNPSPANQPCATSGSTLSCTAICEEGQQVLGGGVSNINTGWAVVQSYPTTETVTGNSSWTVTLNRQPGGGGAIVVAYAVCAFTN